MKASFPKRGGATLGLIDQPRRTPPRLHSGITQEVAPNESQRGPKADAVRSSNLRGVVCGALAPAP